MVRERWSFLTAAICAASLVSGCSAKTAVGEAPKGPGRARAGADSTPDARGRWAPAGFGGAGNYLSVHLDPRGNGVAYAASDVAGVYRSTDYGDRWEIRSLGLGNHEVSSFAIDPFDPNVLYAGVGANPEAKKSGLYLSPDGGASWRHLPASQKVGITFRRWRTVEAIAPDPAARGTLLVGSVRKGIFRTTDGGKSFHQVHAVGTTRAKLTSTDDDDSPKGAYPTPVAFLLFDPSNPKVVYAALDGGGVVKSGASGEKGSWKAANAGLPAQATVKFLAASKGGVLYAALGRAGVYKSTDGAGSWKRVTAGIPLANDEAWVSAVAVHPERPDEAWAVLATYDEPNVWKTTDGGRRWTGKGELAFDTDASPTRTWATDPTKSWYIALDRKHPRRLYYTNFWGIERSDDGGETWADKVSGAQNTCVTSLVVDAGATEEALYAAFMDAGIARSTDGGRSWQMAFPKHYDKETAGHFWGLAVAGNGASKVYYATSDPWGEETSSLYRSSDGVNWRRVYKRARAKDGGWRSGEMVGLAVDPRQPQTVYVTQDGGQVLRSTDGGRRFTPTARQPAGRTFTQALLVDGSGRLFAGTLKEGLFRSTDSGKNWQRVLTKISTVWRVVEGGGALYATAGDDGHLYRSTDGGLAWKALTPPAAPDPGDEVAEQGIAVAVDPKDPKHLVFGRRDTWHSCDASSGLLESRNGGASWQPLNAGMPLRSPSTLAFGGDGALYAGTWCAGTWRLPRPGK
ncbi:MAG: hypothetical protein IT371_20855 [Deltaproteobacteria bacterium]|nr:hypothetical protein [Deltaproteobacteria bacterium]